jgi:hypothetical protein
LQQNAHLFLGLAFFSEGGILSTKCLAASLSGGDVFSHLPGTGGFKFKVFPCTTIFLLKSEIQMVQFLYVLPFSIKHKGTMF